MKRLQDDEGSTLQLAMTIGLIFVLFLGILADDKKLMTLSVSVALAINTLLTLNRYKRTGQKFTLVATILCGVATVVFGIYYLSL